jgi:hypothetical protein
LAFWNNFAIQSQYRSLRCVGSTNCRRRREDTGAVRRNESPRFSHGPKDSTTSSRETGSETQNQVAVAQEASPLATFSVVSNATSTSSRPDLMPLNFAKAISLSAIFHPSHESPASRQQPQGKGETSPGFLLVMAGVQEKLNKACEVLRLTLEQVQSLYAFTTCATLFPLSSHGRPRVCS